MEGLAMMNAFAEHYRGRRVLVTGHTGFTGTWLCHWLLELGASVIGYSKEPATHPSLFELSKASQHLDHHIGDINDPREFARVLQATRPQAILHLAAQPIVADSYLDPVGTMQTNAIGTANLLEAIRVNPWPELTGVVIVTTDKVYGDVQGDRALEESDPLGSGDPYSSSKAMAELVVATYVRLFAAAEKPRLIRIGTARAGNIFGGGDWSPRRLVPDCVRSILDGEPIRLRCPDSVRPWQFVLEPIAGYLHLLTRLETDAAVPHGEGWNLGPPAAGLRTVESVARELIHCGGGSSACEIIREPVGWKETALLRLNSAKAKKFLGWETILTIEEGLRWTFDCYRALRENTDDASVRTVIREQILDYCDLAEKRGQIWAEVPRVHLR
jgi:CDP-glucose 4,6-dehydratase